MVLDSSVKSGLGCHEALTSDTYDLLKSRIASTHFNQDTNIQQSQVNEQLKFNNNTNNHGPMSAYKVLEHTVI